MDLPFLKPFFLDFFGNLTPLMNITLQNKLLKANISKLVF
jgi:hypothetical protein